MKGSCGPLAGVVATSLLLGSFGCQPESEPPATRFVDPPVAVVGSFARHLEARTQPLDSAVRALGYDGLAPLDSAAEALDGSLGPMTPDDVRRGVFRGEALFDVAGALDHPSRFSGRVFVQFVRIRPDTTWYLLTDNGYIHAPLAAPGWDATDLPADLHASIWAVLGPPLGVQDYYRRVLERDRADERTGL